jgi:LuxR family maltose regulon positive regulatory protein
VDLRARRGDDLSRPVAAGQRAGEAEQLLLEAYESYGAKNDTYALFVLQSLGFVYLHSGQLDQARRTTQRLRQASISSGITLMKNWADWFQGMVCFQRNELETASQYFAQIFENRYTAQVSPYRDAVAGLALIRQSQGDSAEALRMVESISQFDLEQGGGEDERTRSLRARLRLMQGDREGAGRWADTFHNPPPDQPLMWLEEPQVTRARILSASAAEPDRRSALQVLDALKEIAGRTCNSRYMIEILAMRAVTLDGLGESTEADAELARAVELARPGGILRAFTDLGQPVQAMLHRLAAHGPSAEAARRIVALPPDEVRRRPDGHGRANAGRHPGLPEPLTPREIEVLTLLRGPLSIKEIAAELSISYATAKRHTINVYGKLGVRQRWSAVARAEELDLLPPR